MLLNCSLYTTFEPAWGNNQFTKSPNRTEKVDPFGSAELRLNEGQNLQRLIVNLATEGGKQGLY